jgi:hypothetical protein
MADSSSGWLAAVGSLVTFLSGSFWVFCRDPHKDLDRDFISRRRPPAALKQPLCRITLARLLPLDLFRSTNLATPVSQGSSRGVARLVRSLLLGLCRRTSLKQVFSYV